MARPRSHASLDRILEPLAADPETFQRRAKTLARRWDREGASLEIRDSSSWRKPGAVPSAQPGDGVVSIEDQLRAEIDQIEIKDRASEARLARRIEFARLRFTSALERAGIQEADAPGLLRHDPVQDPEARALPREVPVEVRQRWLELHAMRREMVEGNLYLALINMERYAKMGAPRLDLIQEGSVVLFKAVDGFDWRRGLYFRTYAVHWLNQAFRSYMYNHGRTVRVPVYLQKAMKHVNRAKSRLGGGVKDTGLLAKESGLKESVVIGALGAERGTISLSSSYANGDAARSAIEWIPDERLAEVYQPDMEDVSLEEGLAEAMGNLLDREKLVLGLRFGLGRHDEHTLSEVADLMGVSLERVRQIQMRAIDKLRTPTLRRAVGPFL